MRSRGRGRRSSAPALAGWLALAACTPDPGRALFEGRPRFELDPYGAAPLAGRLVATTTEPVVLEVEVTAEDVSFVVAGDGPSTRHVLPILGLRADQRHELVVTARSGRSVRRWPRSLKARTAPLPDDFPTLELVSTTVRRAPGVDLFHVDAGRRETEYVVMTDSRGEVVWYHASRDRINHVVRTSRGTLWLIPERFAIEEIDVYGRRVRRWVARTAPEIEARDVAVDTLAFHHDVVELPSGNLLGLGVQLHDVADFPLDESDPTVGGPARVAYDALVEVDLEGEVVRELSLGDVLDPLRVGWGSVSSGWWSSYLGEPVRDWGHANSVAYDPETERALVSIRHQDAVVSLHWPSGALDWVLAPPENWSADLAPFVLRAAAGTRPPFHQHDAQWVSADEVVMFDNGNHQASAGQIPVSDDAIDSRAVMYAVDPVSGTFERRWVFDDLPEPNFSAGLGGAQPLGTPDHVLVTYGIAAGDPAWESRVLEIDRSTGEVVHDFAIASGEGRIYRATRIDSPYPDGTPVE